eukprot:TRINITY_DN67026_c1_g2_i12.p1 TRINITY_DN67026_c1_g2~~TRINITY_DN67026_c1_g2_i12.p1  ORF type:complete len:567 (-),score=97.04 TRINITY_DN67026_c1_g2_i12:82-1782(-)
MTIICQKHAAQAETNTIRAQFEDCTEKFEQEVLRLQEEMDESSQCHRTTVERMQMAIQEITMENHKLMQELENRGQSLKDAAALQEHNQQLQSELDLLNVENSKLMTSVQERTQEVGDCRQEGINLANQLESRNTKIEQLEAENAEALRQLDLLQEEKAHLQTDVARLKSQEEQGRLLQKQLYNLQDDKIRLSSEARQAGANITNLQNQVNTLNQKLESKPLLSKTNKGIQVKHNVVEVEVHELVCNERDSLLQQLSYLRQSNHKELEQVMERMQSELDNKRRDQFRLQESHEREIKALSTERDTLVRQYEHTLQLLQRVTQELDNKEKDNGPGHRQATEIVGLANMMSPTKQTVSTAPTVTVAQGPNNTLVVGHNNNTGVGSGLSLPPTNTTNIVNKSNTTITTSSSASALYKSIHNPLPSNLGSGATTEPESSHTNGAMNTSTSITNNLSSLSSLSISMNNIPPPPSSPPPPPPPPQNNDPPSPVGKLLEEINFHTKEKNIHKWHEKDHQEKVEVFTQMLQARIQSACNSMRSHRAPTSSVATPPPATQHGRRNSGNGSSTEYV